MSKIHMLSEQVCNKIAAGEVVERPASVVKELVENALDAGALKITVSIEKAGEKLISVLDNGEGMDEDDAMLCFESHATSKIKDDADIFAINSFGFRGEAIPSIASVSRFSIRSRRRDNPEGTEVTVHAGKMIDSHPIGCAPGTEVIVRDLFYNLPARRKFMRTAATEERHIIECITNLSLAHPEVSFELKLDGRTMISSPSADKLQPRIRELFGKEFGDALLPVSKTEYGIKITGFISKRSFTKNSRGDQRTFVNGRCIESQALYRGIREGCGPSLEKGRYQVAILFLSLPPGEVDVNVHPTKREVRFRREFEVISAVRGAITAALKVGDPILRTGYIPSEIPPDNETSYDPAAPVSQEQNVFKSDENTGQSDVKTNGASPLFPDFAPGEALPGRAQIPSSAARFAASLPAQTDLGRILESAKVEYQPMNGIFTKLSGTSEFSNPEAKTEMLPFQSERETPNPEAVDFQLNSEDTPNRSSAEEKSAGVRIMGILENSYLVGAIPGGLVLIDQHAAHERVLFEQILKGTNGVRMQRLLLPITVELSRSAMQYVSRNKADFESVGFEIEVFGQNTIKLNGIPSAIPQDNAGGLFQDLLSRLSDEGAIQKNAVEKIARAACKAAVKAHDHLTMEECDALVRQLAKCDLPFSCPHGRPTILNISMNEIERRFGRK